MGLVRCSGIGSAAAAAGGGIAATAVIAATNEVLSAKKGTSQEAEAKKAALADKTMSEILSAKLTATQAATQAAMSVVTGGAAMLGQPAIADSYRCWSSRRCSRSKCWHCGRNSCRLEPQQLVRERQRAGGSGGRTPKAADVAIAVGAIPVAMGIAAGTFAAKAGIAAGTAAVGVGQLQQRTVAAAAAQAATADLASSASDIAKSMEQKSAEQREDVGKICRHFSFRSKESTGISGRNRSTKVSH